MIQTLDALLARPLQAQRPETWTWWGGHCLVGEGQILRAIRHDGLLKPRLEGQDARTRDVDRLPPTEESLLPPSPEAALRRALSLACGPEGRALASALPDAALLAAHAHGVEATWACISSGHTGACLHLHRALPGREFRPRHIKPQRLLGLPPEAAWRLRLCLGGDPDDDFVAYISFPLLPATAHARADARRRLAASPLPPETLHALGVP